MTFTLNFKDVEINYILKLLSSAPYNEVSSLITNICEQAKAQTSASDSDSHIEEKTDEN